MKRYLSMLVVLMATFFTLNVFAFTPPPAPANGGYVVDKTGKLSESQIAQLNQKIDKISKSTKNEFGILLLPTMDGDNIEDVANSTYRSWGVGKRGLDNGCLIVVSLKERKSRIETGKGVEGEIPDLKANDILKKNLNPHLKQGDFYGGFDSTLDALSSTMESRHGQKADPAPSPSCATSVLGGDVIAWPLVVIGVLLTTAWLLVRRASRKAKEELESRLQKERERLQLIKQRNQKLAEEALKARAKKESTPPSKPVPEVKEPNRPPPFVKKISKPRVPRPSPRNSQSKVAPTVASVAAATAVHQAEQDRLRREREAKAEEDRRVAERRRRERDEEDRRRRQREEDDRRSSISSTFSSNPFDFGGGSDGGGFGGFGGGDSGGGGSSSDW